MERPSKRLKPSHSQEDNEKSRVWGGNDNGGCSSNETMHSVNNKPEKTLSDSTSPWQGVTIKNLVKKQICPAIQVEVVSIHPRGLLKTATGRDYLPFTVGDASGSMTVMAWADLAAPLSRVIKIGQIIRIIKGNVENVPDNARSAEPVYRMTLGASSSVEILLENGKTHSVDANSSKISVPMENEKRDDPPPMKKPSMTPTKECKISDLTYPHTLEIIKLHVKCMVTNGVALTPKGFKYVDFVGTDETGDINCIIFEPHSYTIGSSIREGVYLQIEKAIVEPVEERFQTHCKNNHQIKVLYKGHVQILEEKNNESVEDEMMSDNLMLVEDPVMKVTDLKAPQICQYIELTVKSLETNCPSVGRKGLRFRSFIGEDSTGLIRCTIFEPHRFALDADALKVGLQLGLKNALVIAQDMRIPFECDNDLEIITDGSSAVAQLGIGMEEMDDTCWSIRLENFNELANQALGTYIDVVGVIGKPEDNCKSGHSPGCSLTLIDESSIEVTLLFENELYVDSSWTAGTIIEVNRALVDRGENDQMQLLFLPEHSVIRKLEPKEDASQAKADSTK
ncbi:uncharacterized protein [Fopius arisanus]|uniref:Uncharacterized protein n=3 Tax=Fopius arisanus TaxID=64838 RepID=A0A9R1TGZ5_9HYME|nr:PREDICTED: uncharacterized protein LOC105269934 [Fopius arisanus]